MNRRITIQKSKKKDKRYSITMEGFSNMETHSHDFGSKGASTFVDNRTEKEKQAWIARHKNDKNYNNIHSSIHASKSLLWNTNNLKKNLELLGKKLNAKIIVKGKL